MTSPLLYDVAIIGSGAAATILARALHKLGLRVILTGESDRKTAPSESSTPLANLSLERLARRFGLEDLYLLAGYGRWREHFPELDRGLNRGSCFYRHVARERFDPGSGLGRRVLIETSADDTAAATHWRRDVLEGFLRERARGEGVELALDFEVATIRRSDEADGPFELAASATGPPIKAQFVIFGDGPGGVAASELGSPPVRSPARARSGVVWTHLVGATGFVQALRLQGTELGSGPFADDRAAMHHLFDEGWLRVLPSDGGRLAVCLSRYTTTSGAGFADLRPQSLWNDHLAQFPSLAMQFRQARPVEEWTKIERVQFRRRHASGRNWALLPSSYAFFDPMFSSSSAWSLLAVERLADCFERLGPARQEKLVGEKGLFDAYAESLEAEADQLERLSAATAAAIADFDDFIAVATLFFAITSHEEMSCRLRAEPRADIWRGFLGAGDPSCESLLEEAAGRLGRIARMRSAAVGASDAMAHRFRRWVRSSIGPRDLFGLADARRVHVSRNPELLIERAGLIDLRPDDIVERLVLAGESAGLGSRGA